MILGFKKQFVEKIKSGEKIHTLREDKKGRWVENKIIHFATGVRTIKYNCFKEGFCKSVQAIQINYYNPKCYPHVIVDGRLFNQGEVWEMALNDGFKTIDDFCKWFDKDFQGRIIHWTDFKYQL